MVLEIATLSVRDGLEREFESSNGSVTLRRHGQAETIRG